MSSIALAEARVNSLKRGLSVCEIRDTKLRGFGVRVRPSGAKRLFVHAQHRGKRVGRQIGDANAMSLDAARPQAASMLAQSVPIGH